jgi:hypothetical protein
MVVFVLIVAEDVTVAVVVVIKGFVIDSTVLSLKSVLVVRIVENIVEFIGFDVRSANAVKKRNYKNIY